MKSAKSVCSDWLPRAVFTASFVVSASAWAQPPPNPPTSTEAPVSAGSGDKADDFFLMGKALFAEGKLLQAYAAYTTAWGLEKRYDIAGNLGNVAFQLGRMREAAEYLSYCNRNFPADGTPQQLAKVRARLAEARAKVASVTVGVSVAGAEVSIDGKGVGVSPLGSEVFVEPGARRLEVKLQGYKTARGAVQALSGGTYPVQFELVREETEAPGGGGGVGRTALIIGGAVVSATALGMGIGFTVAANGKGSDAAASLEKLKQETSVDSYVCPGTGSRVMECEELRNMLVDQEKFANIALGSFLAGGVLALGTAGFAIWTRPKTPKDATPKALVMPVIGTSSGGVLVVGAW